jgi:purine-cytosine permease-like protein
MSKVAFLSVSCLVVACGVFIVLGATVGDAWRATADFLRAGGFGIFAMVVVVVVRGRKRQ